jgi:lycopene cyclase domain-containing protein
MDRFQYLLVLSACLAITLPLELLLGARVYRRPRRLLRALVPTVLLFAAVDGVAIARDDWSYAARYMVGWTVPPNLPVEEVAFFLVVPLCGLLSLEAVRRLRVRRPPSSAGDGGSA